VKSISRRDFLVVSALAGAGVATGSTAAADAASQEADWFDRPMRWAQLTLVENDPGRYDPAFWLDYFKRIHANAACLSAGGGVAYYPTEVPLHHRKRLARRPRLLRRAAGRLPPDRHGGRRPDRSARGGPGADFLCLHAGNFSPLRRRRSLWQPRDQPPKRPSIDPGTPPCAGAAS